METNNDKLLKDFFSENKKEIVDFGFSQRVMRKLPEVTDHSWIVWIFGAIGVMLTILLGFQIGIIQYILLLLHIIPQIFIFIGTFSLSVISAAIVLIAQNKHLKLI